MSFTLRLQPSQHRLRIDGEQPILDAMEAQGFMAPHACRTASCGACRAKLISGHTVYPSGEKVHGLSEDEITEGFILPCSAHAQSDLELEWEDVLAPGERAVTRLSLAVISLDTLTDDIWRLRLQLPPSTRPRFDAGQYLLMLLPDDAEHAFSIASAPEQRELELHIRAVQGHAAALAIIEHLQRRSIVTVKLPLGRARLPDNDRPVLMIAGGTGITPMRSIVLSLAARGCTRPVDVYWGASEPEQFYLLDELRALAAQHAWLRVTPVLSGALPEWQGARGFPHELALRDTANLAEREIFLGGSEPMTRVVYQALRAAGVPDAQIHGDWLELAQLRTE